MSGPPSLPGDLLADLAKIRLLLLDVDGVLTDGLLHFDEEGRETKVFHVQDGVGLKYWNLSGFVSGFLSGRDVPVVRQRAAELQVQEVHLGEKRKLEILRDILARRGMEPSEVCFLGDDLLDLPVLQAVGVPMTVPGGRPEVKEVCRYVTRAEGGRGAVREVVDLLLRARGRFQEFVEAAGLPGEAEGGRC